MLHAVHRGRALDAELEDGVVLLLPADADPGHVGQRDRDARARDVVEPLGEPGLDDRDRDAVKDFTRPRRDADRAARAGNPR
jgi:hypothetical protein